MKTPSSDERFSKIREWLEEILPDEQFDDSISIEFSADGGRNHSIYFEKNSKIIDGLEFLIRLNESVESQSQIQDGTSARFLEKTNQVGENYLETEILQNFQSPLRQLRLRRLATDNLRILTELSKLIPLSDCLQSDDAFANFDESAISIMSVVFRQEAENDAKIATLSHQCRSLEESLNRLISDKRCLDEEFEKKSKEMADGRIEDEVAQKRKDLAFMRKKSQRYANHVDQLRFELQDIRLFDPSTLSKSALEEHDRRNQELKRKLEELQKKLQRYRSLPPNLELARIRLEEAKQRARELREQVDEHFGTT